MACPRIYLHGVPGSPGELALIDQRLRDDPRLFAPDRNALSPARDPVSRIGALAAACRERFGDESVRLVAFSLGAPIALALADRLGEQVAGIDLIAPAAPLGDGGALKDMAGGPLFRLAAKSPRLFGIVCRLQGLAAARWPGFLASQLFASAAGQDRELWSDPRFREGIAAVLRSGLGQNWRAYRDEIVAYVAMDEQIVDRIAQPVSLWHGTADNWAPVSMSESLAARLPCVAGLHRLDGLSHYSALRHYWTRVCPSA